MPVIGASGETVNVAAVGGMTVTTPVARIVGAGGTGGGSNPAAAILITPSLTPADGDIIQAIYWQPGTPARPADPGGDPWEQVAIPADWALGETFTFDSLNDEGVGEHVLLMIPVDGSTYPDDYYPTVYAEVTLTEFVPVELMGSAPVHISCGGAGYLGGALWIGRNDEGATEGTPGVTDEAYPATRFEPTHVTEGEVATYSDRTGNLAGMGRQKDVNDWLDALDLSGAGGGAVYYQNTIAVQPWEQTGADFGASASAFVAAHVIQSSSLIVHATVTFTCTLAVTTPGTGAPQFFVREMFRSLDFDGWFWGWNSPNVRCSVHGLIGGLPFVGFVDRTGSILDADGNEISRVLVTGDWLAGTATGVFQND